MESVLEEIDELIKKYETWKEQTWVEARKHTYQIIINDLKIMKLNVDINKYKKEK